MNNPQQIREIRDLVKIIKSDPKYTPTRSYDWFKRQVAQLGAINTRKFLKQATFTQIMPGFTYLFEYDPKGKDTLPYYDRLPLVIPFGKDETGFIGLNMHYVHPKYRLLLLARLNHFKVKTNNNEQRLLMSWEFIKNASKYPEVAPCVKRYLFSHVRSKFLKVPDDDWMVMSQMPTQMFVGAKDAAIWTDSKRKMNVK
jgi:hypothetical protein